jgi:hypothetical protein
MTAAAWSALLPRFRKFGGRLGYASSDEFIRNGYNLDPEEVRLAVRLLNIRDPEHPVSIDVLLCQHGGVWRRKEFQGSDTTLKGRGATYLVARLKRDRPDLTEQVISGGYRLPPPQSRRASAAALSRFPTILRRRSMADQALGFDAGAAVNCLIKRFGRGAVLDAIDP